MDPLDIILDTAAALEPSFRPVLLDYCAILDAESCFDELCREDAEPVALVICADVCTREDPGEVLRARARSAAIGEGCWVDRDGVARALAIAAGVFGL